MPHAYRCSPEALCDERARSNVVLLRGAMRDARGMTVGSRRLAARSVLAVVAIALAGCGGSSAASPTEAVGQWDEAVVGHDGGKLCELSTATRQARQLNFAQLLGGSSCADGENKILELPDRIDRPKHFKPRVIHESKTRAEVEAWPGSIFKLERLGGHWYISETDEEGEVVSHGSASPRTNTHPAGTRSRTRIV